ncbi:MAG: UbiH/UbiF family hydroxylase [Betaproteobacteria bacterium]
MKFDVAIVGGSVVGASLACALAAADLRVLIVDPRAARALPAEGFDQRIYALNGHSRRFLEGIGVWRRLAPGRFTPVRDMQVFGDGASSIEFSAYRNGVADLATIVEEANLLQALRAAFPEQPNLTLLCTQCTHAEWDAGGARLSLSDGTRVEANLVVAADGAESALRKAAGLDAHIHDYGESGLVANFRIEKPHQDTAWQWFLGDGMEVGGVLAMLPLPGAHVSMVWSMSDDHARRLRSAEPEELAGKVETATSGRFGRVTLIGEIAAFPLRRMRVERLVARRLALIGDTAHNIHPLAGQGLNLGLADAQSLAGILLARGPENDCGAPSLLRRYERSRREDLLAMEAVTDGLHALFGNRTVAAKRLRNEGLRLTNRVAPIKRWLVKRAMG